MKEGCFVIILAFLTCFIINFLLTMLVLWLSAGLFNYPLDDKFWYIFVLILIIEVFIGKNK